MFATKNASDLVEKLTTEVDELGEYFSSLQACSSSQPNSDLVKKLVCLRDSLDGVCSIALGEYVSRGDWAQDNYLSGKSAIVHETGLSRGAVDASIASAKVLTQYPEFMEGLCSGQLTSDHVKLVAPLLGDKHCEFFDDDHMLLFETACKLPSGQFTNVVKHWKNMVDAVNEDLTDDIQAFESRKLFFHQLYDGSYFLQGQFDAINGEIIKKALEQVQQKIWNNTEPMQRHNCSPSQLRADALVQLAQNFVSDKSLSAPALSADIVIDIKDLVPQSTTTEFLERMINEDTPIVSTHSARQLKQILCDCELSVPIKLANSKFDLGRKVRTAPAHLKKQLILESNTCSIKGCEIPARWCDAHHKKHWIDGGHTSLDNLELLCPRHHTIHHLKLNENNLSPP